jgi:threonine aldolase
MGNQIAVKLHTRHGEEAIIEERGHILNHELGAAAAISGVTLRPVKSAASSGMLTWEEIAAALNIGGAYYSTRTGLICLENTDNFGGGSVMTADECAAICKKAHAAGVPVHMDGARIFNASVALDTPVAELTRHCDSVQFSLSKGLGAPVGGILLGSKTFIEEAKTWRKRLGGGMRQIGILGAAGLIALEDGPKRLYEDHGNARRLAQGLVVINGNKLDPDSVVTNIVFFDISATGMTSPELCIVLKEKNILAGGIDDRTMRMVTHLGISANDVDQTLVFLRSIFDSYDKLSDRDAKSQEQ